ncbi:MAG TPA: ATP-binding protein, partial [Burkholderiales bacterium]|nr:ATP-binding protein [Burkholderiales bacterium]
LLVNAAKYTESGGRIALDVTTDNGKAYISVKDTGVGIPEHMLTRIFDMFTQVDSSISLAQGGLGIGLTIVKRLVEMHGGTVSVHSRGRGMGSEFTIRLPAEASLVGEPQSENKAAAHTNAVQHRILVVDDNKEAALSLTLMLQLMGNDAQSAYDGAEAVKVAELYRPDIVLMDIAMPKLNGYAAARLIREQSWGKGVALVAVTGWGQEVDRKTSQESGFDHHLVKPVEPQDLEKLLMSFDPTTAGRPV